MSKSHATPYFDGATFKFLQKLSRNNNREWFTANKARYEASVRGPALALITDLAEPLAAISPKFRAVPKAVGGSLFRIQRDTRFSNNKLPYKTWIGLRFFHERGRDGDAPLFYLHIEPGNSFVGGGLWHPQTAALRKIRDYLIANPMSWKALCAQAAERGFAWGGESLLRAPRGYEPDHELIEHLKRKDFVLSRELSDDEVLSDQFGRTIIAAFDQVAPLVDWLCDAVEVDF
jgi:uncharacterized protein (TIGR02453 family)